METKNLLKSLKQRLSWLIMLTALLCGTQSVFGGTIPPQQYTYHHESGPYAITDFALTKIDNNHYKGSMVITGSSVKYCFTMKGADNKYYRNKGFWFGTNEEADISATEGDKMYISPKWTSGKIDVSLELYCEYSGNSKLIVKQTQHTADKCSNVDVTNILDGTNMMFYISQDYNNSDLCIYNGSNYISGTKIVDKKAYINTAVSDIDGKTINVSNNCGNWPGTGGFTSVAAGSYLKTGNSSPSTVNATTLSTFSTPTTTVSVGASSVAIKTKANSTESSYGDALKICFYIGDKSYGTCNATTTETSTNIDVSSLPAGTYTIKAVLSDSRIAYLDSMTISLTISDCTTPTATQYPVSNNTYTYDGTVKTVSITPVDDAGAVTKIYYDGVEGGKTNAGTYKVTIDSEAGSTYCAASGLEVGNLVISKATPIADNFNVSGLEQTYTGEALNVTVTAKDGISGMGAVTVNIEGGHIVPGSYAVTFDVAEGTNYSAATGLTAGTLVISKANQTTAVVVGDLVGTPCGAGDYTLTASGGNSTGAYSFEIVSGGTGEATISGSTLTVTKAGTIKVKAKRAGDSNYNDSDWGDSKTLTINGAPTAGFAISASSTTPEIISRNGQVDITLSTSDATALAAAYKNWYCSNTPAVSPTISDASVAIPTVTFHREGVYKFKLKAGCNSASAVESAEITVTVSGKLYIKGPVHDNGCWPGYNSTAWVSNESGVYTNTFTAYKNCSYGATEYVLSRKANDDNTLNGYDGLTMSFDPDAANCNWAFSTRSGQEKNYAVNSSFYEAGETLTITVTHIKDKEWKMKVTKNCVTPSAKTIEISDTEVCFGNTVTVTVKSSESGMLYNLYRGTTKLKTVTGTGSDVEFEAITPDETTSYSVKAQSLATCEEADMSNTVSVTVAPSPVATPATGITQYLPVTVSSTKASPVWSATPTGGYFSAESGATTVFKAPTGTYTISDGKCSTTIIVSPDTETCN